MKQLLIFAAVILSGFAACTEQNINAKDGAVTADQTVVGPPDAAKKKDASLPTKDGAPVKKDATDSKKDGEAVPDAMPPAKDLGPNVECQVDCDCPQGLYCSKQGKCLAGATPVYCCSKPGCPLGFPCTNPDGSPGKCPNSSTIKCKYDCDCPQGIMCLNGLCNNAGFSAYCCSKPGCPKGQVCTNPNGTKAMCPSTSSKCKSHCDCPQGIHCENGNCVKKFPPRLCCTNPGCPKWMPCFFAAGTKGQCK